MSSIRKILVFPVFGGKVTLNSQVSKTSLKSVWDLFNLLVKRQEKKSNRKIRIQFIQKLITVFRIPSLWMNNRITTNFLKITVDDLVVDLHLTIYCQGRIVNNPLFQSTSDLYYFYSLEYNIGVQVKVETKPRSA